METETVAQTAEKSAEAKQIVDSYCCTNTAGDNIHTACSIVGKALAGVGIGVVGGISLVVAAAAADVAVPALLLLKAFGLTGGALGFVTGIKKN
jgi:hypothetical protein